MKKIIAYITLVGIIVTAPAQAGFELPFKQLRNNIVTNAKNSPLKYGLAAVTVICLASAASDYYDEATSGRDHFKSHTVLHIKPTIIKARLRALLQAMKKAIENRQAIRLYADTPIELKAAIKKYNSAQGNAASSENPATFAPYEKEANELLAQIKPMLDPLEKENDNNIEQSRLFCLCAIGATYIGWKTLRALCSTAAMKSVN